jgi:hypothetical protein
MFQPSTNENIQKNVDKCEPRKRGKMRSPPFLPPLEASTGCCGHLSRLLLLLREKRQQQCYGAACAGSRNMVLGRGRGRRGRGRGKGGGRGGRERGRCVDSMVPFSSSLENRTDAVGFANRGKTSRVATSKQKVLRSELVTLAPD